MEVEQKISVTVLHVGVVLQTYAPFTSLQPLLLARFQCYDPHAWTHARMHARTHACTVSGSRDEDTAATSLLSRISPEAPSPGQISH